MFRDFQVKNFARIFILSFVLPLNLFLFLYSISQDLLLIASSIHIGIVSINISAVAMLLVLAYIIKHSNTIRPYYIIYVIVFITLITSMFEYSLSLMNGLTEVGEQAPDATIYAIYNHWIFSIKNPYYDIINVASFWIAMLHMILGVNDIVFAMPNLILYLVIAILISLSVYIIYKRANSQNHVIMAMLMAFATPYITFVAVPPALSAMYAVLIYAIISGRVIRSSDYAVMTLLGVVGVLTHATSIAMIIFGLASLFILSKIYRDVKGSVYLHMLMFFTIIYMAISFARFIYTTAYVSLYPYYADFLRFLNFLSSPGSVELRATRYEQWSPLFTSFSWTIYPALSASYILATIFKRRYSYNEFLALSLSLAGLALIFTGFVGSRFSNSFSREVAYPGYMLLFIGSFEAFKHINLDRIGRIIMMIILVMGVFSGFFTVKNAPWLYVGKIPYLTYRPPTSSEIILAEDLLKLSMLGDIRSFKIYQEFDPGLYLVKMIEWRLIGPYNISSLGMNIQPMSSMGSMNVSDIIFNSPLLYVSR
jgi:hypothetical protein